MKKKFLIMYALILSTSLSAQEKIIIQKASDTIATKVIVVPDEIFNDNFTLEQNEQAIIHGRYVITDIIFYDYDNFYIQKKLTQRILLYESGNKVSMKEKITEMEPCHIAWGSMGVTFGYFVLVIFLIIRDKEGSSPAIPILAAAVAVVVAAPAVGAAAAAVVAAVVAVVGAAVVAADKEYIIFFRTYVAVSLVGMALVGYFFTPLFFVVTLAGCICGWLLAQIKIKI